MGQVTFVVRSDLCSRGSNASGLRFGCPGYRLLHKPPTLPCHTYSIPLMKPYFGGPEGCSLAPHKVAKSLITSVFHMRRRGIKLLMLCSESSCSPGSSLHRRRQYCAIRYMVRDKVYATTHKTARLCRKETICALGPFCPFRTAPRQRSPTSEASGTLSCGSPARKP